MKQEFFGFGLVVLALMGGLLLAKYSGSSEPAFILPELGATQVEDISITQAWVAETIGGQSRTAAYFSITNGSGGEESLMGASSSDAAHTSLHRTQTVDDISSMQAIDALTLQPGTVTQLAPGGLHVMIMGLDGPLEAGGSISLTLDFLEAGEVTFDVPVVARTMMMDHMEQ